MSLSPATIVHQGNVAGGVMPDISSALGYKEHVGSACINPNGYTAGSYFVGADDGYFYCVTANIAAGDTITIGTNCVQTDVGAEIKSIKSDLKELTYEMSLTTKASDITDMIRNSIAKGFTPYATCNVGGAFVYFPLSYLNYGATILFSTTHVSGATYAYTIVIGTNLAIKYSANGSAPGDYTSNTSNWKLHYHA